MLSLLLFSLHITARVCSIKNSSFFRQFVFVDLLWLQKLIVVSHCFISPLLIDKGGYMFSNLRIRAKILLGFCLVLLSVGGIFLYVNSVSRAMSSTSEDVVNNWMPSIRELGVLSQSFTLYRVREFRLLLSKTPDEVSSANKQLSEAKQNAIDAEKKYSLLVTPGEEERIYKEYQKLVEEYWVLSQKIMSLAQSGSADEARILAFGIGKEKYDAISAKIKELTAYNATNGDKRGQEVISLAHKIFQTFILSGVTIIVLILGVGFLLGTMISNPIVQVQVAAEKASKGDLKQTLTINSSDEIGQLAKSFQIMINNLRTMIEREEKERQYLTERSAELSDAMDVLSRGDLTTELPKEDHEIMGLLFNRYNHAVANMSEAIRRVTDVVASGVSATSQITASTEELSSGSRSQLSEVNSIAAAVYSSWGK